MHRLVVCVCECYCTDYKRCVYHCSLACIFLKLWSIKSWRYMLCYGLQWISFWECALTEVDAFGIWLYGVISKNTGGAIWANLSTNYGLSVNRVLFTRFKQNLNQSGHYDTDTRCCPEGCTHNFKSNRINNCCCCSSNFKLQQFSILSWEPPSK